MKHTEWPRHIQAEVLEVIPSSPWSVKGESHQECCDESCPILTKIRGSLACFFEAKPSVVYLDIFLAPSYKRAESVKFR
ncbi:hypothetical protein TGRH88_077930 [Toxoplasma gondii]|uniref:Uncharacterized protein n=1 Tax=Toxoplasma gondii TaxID=5811 RepID=A0A7J6K673_TOXGO|nr:hypothetical protein TGRH88_077930 [Toxoplasma gondii]